MQQQTTNDIPLGHPWTQRDLMKQFHAVKGGVALPGKNPGFAIVAGLRPPETLTEQFFEVHVLDEYESWDMKAILRQCRGLGSRYNITVDWHEDRRDRPFDWYGDGRNTSVRAIIRDSNEGYRGAGPLPYRHREDVHLLTTPTLDWEQPYPPILGDLKEYLEPDRKQLYLRGSRVEGYLAQIKPDEQTDLLFGSFPAIEALAFVVKALRDEAGRWQRRQLYREERSEEYDPLRDRL